MHIPPNSLSYWEQKAFFSDIDLVVIGSGIVGVQSALHYKKLRPDAKVVIVDRGVLPEGASTRNAGFACFGSMTELLSDVESMGEIASFELVERRLAGLEKLFATMGKKQIGYRQDKGYEVFKSEEEFDAVAGKIGHFNSLLKPITGNSETFLVDNAKIKKFGFAGVSHIICNQSEGTLDTSMLVNTMLEKVRKAGIRLFQGFSVEKLEQTSAGVDILTRAGWTINAKQVLVTTNGFARQLLPQLEVNAGRNQVLVTKPIPGLKIKGSFHYDRGYFYFRNIDNRILLGGGRNLFPVTEQTDTFGVTQQVQDVLTDMLYSVIVPGQKPEIEYWWSGILGLGPVKKPIIECVSDRIGVAVRMGGMGVAIGSLVGKEAAVMMAGRL